MAWVVVCSDSDYSLIRRNTVTVDTAKERKKGYLLGISAAESAGLEASQAAEDTGCYTSSISAKATISAKLSQHEIYIVRNQ